ncbi:MAG: ComEC/Rec2 family competence protein [Alphaproteobacteria bacterium]|nr:ComEC/Rec2 family competence protein [Alphaproteobacteria bacterium]
MFFFFVRRVLSLLPKLALHFPLKKIAALLAWVGTLFYLILCNFAVPASRAFVMISLFFAGVLLDRLALSMRSVAFAASVILLVKPEALIHPSFQLSFAAVTALIAFYEKSSNSPTVSFLQRRFKSKLLAYCVGLVISSLIATVATTPYIASFFHRITLQSITGNMVGVPMLGFLIMPLLLLFLLSLPFGGSPLIAKALAICLETLKSYVTWVSSLKGAAIPVPMISSFAVSLLTLSLLWMILWKSRWRYYGLVGCVASLLWMLATPQPNVFIDAKRRLIAIKDPLHKTIVVNTLQSARFSREVFKEALGVEKVERIPSKEGLYTYGDLEVRRSYDMLEVRQGGSTLAWHFMNKDLVHATLNDQKIDLEIHDPQGILLFWNGADLSLLGSKKDDPKRPWQ